MRFNELATPYYSDEENGGVVESAEPEAEEEAEARTYTEEEVQQRVNEAVNQAVKERLARERKKMTAEKDKAVAEAEKLAKMSASEKLEHQLATAREELEVLKTEKARAEMLATAKQMLEADGLKNVPDAVVKVLITDDADATAEAVKSFSASYQLAVQEGIKETLKGETPKRGGNSALTKEEILSISNTKERLRAINENLDLFKK